MSRTFIFLIAGAVVASSHIGCERAQSERAQSDEGIQSTESGNESLDIYFLDMEGGGGTLIVSPSGESMVVDAGNPGVRDAERIVAAAKEAGLEQIDYFLASHYHPDHYGGVAELAARFSIRTFVDMGSNPEELTERSAPLFEAYTDAREKSRHLEVKVGDKIPLAGVDITVVTSRGETLKTPLGGAGAPNPLCDDFTPREKEQLGDQVSIGVLVSYGDFRALQLGDLTWNKEHELVCPNNLIGTVDLFQTSAHGMNLSGSKSFVHALRPRVVVINNSSFKGGTRETIETIKTSPRFEDLWLLHFAEQREGESRFFEFTEQGGKEFNPPERFIANLSGDEHIGFPQDDTAARATYTPADFIKASARSDGSFVVENSRNGSTKTY